MTIDEFLNRIEVLKRRSDKLLNAYNSIQDETVNPGAVVHYGMPAGRTNRNYTEEKLIKLASAGEKWQKAYEEYQVYYNIFERAMYNLLYWEGLLIERVYITNAAFKHNQLFGVDEILKTRNRAEILAKLETAREHLKQILNENGMKIE